MKSTNHVLIMWHVCWSFLWSAFTNMHSNTWSTQEYWYNPISFFKITVHWWIGSVQEAKRDMKLAAKFTCPKSGINFRNSPKQKFVWLNEGKQADPKRGIKWPNWEQFSLSNFYCQIYLLGNLPALQKIFLLHLYGRDKNPVQWKKIHLAEHDNLWKCWRLGHQGARHVWKVAVGIIQGPIRPTCFPQRKIRKGYVCNTLSLWPLFMPSAFPSRIQALFCHLRVCCILLAWNRQPSMHSVAKAAFVLVRN